MSIGLVHGDVAVVLSTVSKLKPVSDSSRLCSLYQFDASCSSFPCVSTLKYKIFMWLTIKSRLVDGQQVKQSEACSTLLFAPYAVKSLNLQNISSYNAHSRLSREVWYNCRMLYRLQNLTPGADNAFVVWWPTVSSAVALADIQGDQCFGKFCRKIKVELEQWKIAKLCLCGHLRGTYHVQGG